MPDLPSIRLRHLEEFGYELVGREVYFVYHAMPYTDTVLFPWLVGPIIKAAEIGPDEIDNPMKGPRYTDVVKTGDTTYCLHAGDVIANHPKIRGVRLADYNAVTSRYGLHRCKAVFRTAKDAELWQIMLKLSFDDPCPPEERWRIDGEGCRSVFEFDACDVLQPMKRWLNFNA